MKIDETNLNPREKGLFELMLGLGKAIMEEAKKTNVTQEACHSITFSPETGYVKVVMYCDKKVYEVSIFDQFPEIDVDVKEDKINRKKGTPHEDKTAE